MTDCNTKKLSFHPLNRRQVLAAFDGGAISTDAGALLLRELEQQEGIISRFASCFTDHRDARRVRHGIVEMLRQRVFALACGYEDLNDHESLRSDPLFLLLVGVQAADRMLASPSTLNRLELSAAEGGPQERYKRLELDEEAAAESLLETWLAQREAPGAGEPVVLDLDATDVELHGCQEGRAFHGYYDCYCYLPLYVFCGDHLLWAQLRPSNIDPAAGAKDALARIVRRVRERRPDARILVRGDSGFCREEIMAWCEANGVDYVLGLARNSRLQAMIGDQMQRVRQLSRRSGEAERAFLELRYRTRKSWSRPRRVVAKAEHLPKGPNPRFVVTSLGPEDIGARALYEELYCARGEMENRIKETQLGLYADRTSSRAFRANQLRLWLSALAYALLSALRRRGLRGTEMARAQCPTIRLKLLKIGGRIRHSVRRIYLSLSEHYPYQALFRRVLSNLQVAAGYT